MYIILFNAQPRSYCPYSLRCSVIPILQFAEGMTPRYSLLSAHEAQHYEELVSKEDILEDGNSNTSLCSQSTYQFKEGQNLNELLIKKILKMEH